MTGREPEADATRRGNIMARMRMISIFDLSARHHAIPLGTGNKTERLFGYCLRQSGHPDFFVRNQASLRWNHDQTLNPTARLNANVNLTSSSYLRTVSQQYEDNVRQSVSSTIQYSKRWPAGGRSHNGGTKPIPMPSILCEPDGTFSAHDIQKLLAYSDDKPVVLGTRTSPEFIWDGANMGRFLRWGNWAVAKLIQVLYDGPSLTDCGCTLRLLHRSALMRIADGLTVGGTAARASFSSASRSRAASMIRMLRSWPG